VPANIDVVPVLASTIGRVKADVGQLQQILINLLVNARDAMPQGGKVVIETATAEVDEAYAAFYPDLQPGDYVLLSISDEGTGMSGETRLHLFEPFYTTKEQGKGTGLGLSTVYGIVKRIGGNISVESSEGKGTTFRIYMPVAKESVTESRVAAPPPGLVVEDETALRRLISLCLEKRGHRVLAAKDGAVALEIFRQHAPNIQLVVTDVVMPRMVGLELKQLIAPLKPDIKFLFISGYAEQIVEQHCESLERCAFLEKPFLPEELSNKVSCLLTQDAVPRDQAASAEMKGNCS